MGVRPWDRGANIGDAYSPFFDQFGAAAAVGSDPATCPEAVIRKWCDAYKCSESQINLCP